MNRWPHQIRGYEQVVAAIEAGENAICLTSPTGAGKSFIMRDLIEWNAARSKRTILYSNRVLLTEQLARDLTAAGIDHGIQAAGHDPDFSKSVQLSSMQTVDSRVYRSERWPLFPAELVLIDEAHNAKGGVAQQIINDHRQTGAAVVGVTATPLGIGDIYSTLIQAGTTSELRACGALVPCYTFAPDEPDTRDLRRTKTGEFTEGDVVKAIMSPTIFSRVLDNWRAINPDGRPTILFAPGVGESVWFAEQFHAAGISAGHIDGEDIWLNGKSYGTSKNARRDLIEMSQDGKIKIICNRFVLREAIDMPWLAHGILATVFGALTSYLQAGGRLLRSHPSLTRVTIQDHGGSFWRHGSLNADRVWKLEHDNAKVAEIRENALRKKTEPEPISCPRCHAVRSAGSKCFACGFEHHRKSRIVVQRDGSLREMFGDILKPRKVSQTPDTERLWTQCYYRTKHGSQTFKQAEALFFRENHYWPPRTLPLMPLHEEDWGRKVADLPYGKLVPRPAKAPAETPLFEEAFA